MWPVFVRRCVHCKCSFSTSSQKLQNGFWPNLVRIILGERGFNVLKMGDLTCFSGTRLYKVDMAIRVLKIYASTPIESKWNAHFWPNLLLWSFWPMGLMLLMDLAHLAVLVTDSWCNSDCNTITIACGLCTWYNKSGQLNTDPLLLWYIVS